VLRQAKLHPGVALVVIGGLAALLVAGLARAEWRPSAPLRLGRRRGWGQIMASSRRMLRRHPRTFLAIGLLFIPLGMLTALAQFLVFRVTALEPLVDEAGVRNAFVNALAVGLGLVITFFGFAVMQAATAWAAVEIDAGRRPRALAAYRAVLGNLRLRPLVAGSAIAIAVQAVLDLTVVLIPVGLLLVVLWSLFAVSVGVEGRPAGGALRRSGALVREGWWRAAGVTAVAAAALLLGPAIGVLVLLFTGAAFDFVNLIAAVVYVTALPFVALALTYLYFDLRVRHEARAATPAADDDLPAELGGGATAS
jgi:hypothetical protein